MLAPPPDDTANKPEVKPQTEADKVLHQYEDFGKEASHVYGAVGSTVPNFNAKSAPKPVASGSDSTESDTMPEKSAAPAPAPSRPAILGAPRTPDTSNTTAPRTSTTATKPVAPKPATPSPALPLGAPRPKPPATATNSTQPTTQQP